tara:strand:- start:226 stop:555 length:330 start_codon:yes stop_codon:yes gene_type:complete
MALCWQGVDQDLIGAAHRVAVIIKEGASDVGQVSVPDIDEPDVADIRLIKAADVVNLLRSDTVGITDQAAGAFQLGHQLEEAIAFDFQYRWTTPGRDVEGALYVCRRDD